MSTLYWHNLNANNDATDRSNYSTDQAGTTPAADAVVTSRYFQVRTVRNRSLGAGVTDLSFQDEDENRINGVMTADDSPAPFEVSVDGSAGPAYLAFNDDTGDHVSVGSTTVTLTLDMGSPQTVHSLRIRERTASGRQLGDTSLWVSDDGVTWTQLWEVNLDDDLSSGGDHTIPVYFHVAAGDTLRFDGTGTGSGDDWTLSPEHRLTCTAIRFGMFPGVATSDPTAEVTTGWVQIGEDTADSPGTYTALSGTWNLTAIRSDDTGEPGTAGKTLTTFYTSHRQTIGNETDPLDLNILDGGIIRIRAEASPEIYADISSPGTIVVDPDEDSNRTYSLRGSITADEVHANSTGAATLRLLPANQAEVFAANTSLQTLRISNSARVSLTFPALGSGGSSELRGLSKNGTPDSWTDIIMEDQAELRLASTGGGASEGSLFANPVTIADNAQALFSWASHSGSYHQVNLGGHYTIGLNATLTLQRTGNSRGQIDITGNKAYTQFGWGSPFGDAVGTLPPNAGTWEGAGQLRIFGASADHQFYRFYIGDTTINLDGGIELDARDTNNSPPRLGFIRAGSGGPTTVGIGSGKLRMVGQSGVHAKGAQVYFAIREATTLTTDIEVLGFETSDTHLDRQPGIYVRRTTGNPNLILSGQVDIDSWRFAVCARSGGTAAAGGVDFTGPVTFQPAGTNAGLLTGGGTSIGIRFSGGLTVDPAILTFQIGRVAGESSSDLPEGSQIGGWGGIGSPCPVFLNSAVTVEELQVIGGGSHQNLGVVLSDPNALSGVGTLRVEHASSAAPGPARIRFAADASFGGILALKPGSSVRSPSAQTLALTDQGPHEWSAAIDPQTPAECRNLTVVTTIDGTTINYDSADTLNSIPLLRAEANTTLDTATGAVRVIRPGQSLAGDLPAGFTSVQLERGKTLTVGADLRLSLYRTDGQPTGTTGLATISGDGVLIFSQDDGWSPPSFYTLAEFDILTSFAPAEDGAVLSVAGFVGLRDVRVESSSRNLTVNFTDTAVGGDFYAYTSIADGTGNVTVRWAGNNTIEGDYYQRQPQSLPVADAMHRTEFLGASATTIVGDFRPGSDKSGGTGGVSNPYSMDIFAGEAAEITVRGTPFFRNIFHTASYIFQPLDPNGYATPAKFIIDPLATETLMSFESGGVVADMEIRNSAGGARTVGLDTTSLWVNTLTVSGDDITLDLNTSTSDAYLGGLVCTGSDVELRLPNYMEIYTFIWGFPSIPPEAVFDLRGFATVVEGPGAPTIALIPDGTTDLWFDGNPLLLTTVSHDLSYLDPSEAVVYHDAALLRVLEIGATSNRFIEIRDEVVVGDVLATSSTSSPGVTVDVTGVLVVVGELDLRQASSSNLSYDIRLVGAVEYRPRGAGDIRILDFGGPAAGIPHLLIEREAADFPGDERDYAVATPAYPETPVDSLTIRNVSDDIPLHFYMGGDLEVLGDFVTEIPGASTLSVFLNGFDMKLRGDLIMALGTDTVDPSMGDIILLSGTDPHLIEGPTMALPTLQHQAPAGVVLGRDLVAENFYMITPGIGPLDTQGYEMTTIGSTLLLQGSVNLDNLPGTRFTAAQWEVEGMDMNPTGTWYVDSPEAPVATSTTLSNSTSEGAEGNALAATDGGNNVNWDFGVVPVPGGGGLERGLGLGLGLGLVKSE